MIEICEVGPRDGLQNEKKPVSTEEKVHLIEQLIDAGIRKIEAVSFVNQKVVPQMADAEEVMKAVPKREDVTYAGLVLSRSGLERALLTPVDIVHVMIAASDQFNMRNARRTVEQGVAEQTAVMKDAGAAKRPVAGVIGTVFGCPFEGDISISRVLKIADAFLQAGCEQITLADTTGLANPIQVQAVTRAFIDEFGDHTPLGMHFHNTRGLGIANSLAAYQAGVKIFDASIAGLGGCPFAPKAVGNVCTEDLVHMFEQMGIGTGTDLNKLIQTAQWMESVMARPLDGMVYRAVGA
ncbi:hydroxymethylglutaryl-CoA lyase [Bacillus fonticola]|uniref:hydroxymethylglutaryl-CoA lyase n=1 Tax=Bacillus fonticola TaxID=2728853 RepID=UPI001475F142|nr:hydroxymethylglutaryl-CoA lyase [Bacillus fonticola]